MDRGPPRSHHRGIKWQPWSGGHGVVMSTTSFEGVRTIRFAGIDVPRIGYGTMRLPGRDVWGPPEDRTEAVAVLRRAVELGVRLIDTSWYYGPYVADELLREALYPYDGLQIVTKLGGSRRPDKSWHPAITPRELREACERQLRALGVECVAACHLRWMDDGSTTFEDALETMCQLKEEGKIGGVGVSTVTLDQLDSALNRTVVVSVSNAFSFVNRDDIPVLRRCEERGIPYLPYFPLAEGTVNRNAALAEVARAVGASTAATALAWLLATSPVTVPIPGTRSVRHLEENVTAGDLQLSAEQLHVLDTA